MAWRTPGLGALWPSGVVISSPVGEETCPCLEKRLFMGTTDGGEEACGLWGGVHEIMEMASMVFLGTEVASKFVGCGGETLNACKLLKICRLFA